MAPLDNDSLWVRFVAWLGALRGPRSRGHPTDARYFARLPSNLHAAYFQATIAVNAARGSSDPAVNARIHQRLMDAASDASRGYSVLDADEASSAVNLALNHVPVMTDLGIILRTVTASLTVDSQAHEFATRHEQLVRETSLICEQHKEAAKRLAFLHEHMLTSAQMARLWWLDNSPGKLLELVNISREGDEDPFERAVFFLAGRPTEQKKDHIADLIALFLRGLGPDHRKLLISQIGTVFKEYERPDLAGILSNGRYDYTT